MRLAECYFESTMKHGGTQRMGIMRETGDSMK